MIVGLVFIIVNCVDSKKINILLLCFMTNETNREKKVFVLCIQRGY